MPRSIFYVIVTGTAADKVEDGSDRHDGADEPADPNSEVCEGERGAENVEERLEPERVHECTVLVDVLLLDQDAEEEQAEEGVVAFDHPGARIELALRDAQDRVHNGQRTEANSCTVKDTVKPESESAPVALCKLTEAQIKEFSNVVLPSHFRLRTNFIIN